jgi:hypothetical protein
MKKKLNVAMIGHGFMGKAQQCLAAGKPFF